MKLAYILTHCLACWMISFKKRCWTRRERRVRVAVPKGKGTEQLTLDCGCPWRRSAESGAYPSSCCSCEYWSFWQWPVSGGTYQRLRRLLFFFIWRRVVWCNFAT
jgi:hypothetical protein